MVSQDARPGRRGWRMSRLTFRPETCWHRATASWAISKSLQRTLRPLEQGYVRAIAIGRQVLLDEPGSLPFKAHLGLGLDDLAGVARSQGKIDEARKLFQEAEQLYSELVESDPELRRISVHSPAHPVQSGEDGGRRARGLAGRPSSGAAFAISCVS